MLGHITDPGAPGGLDRRDLPEPQPTPHEAVIEVAAYAVNRGELALLARRPDGWTLGRTLPACSSPRFGVVRDWCGTVEAVEALRSRQATGKAVLARSRSARPDPIARHEGPPRAGAAGPARPVL